MKNYARRQSNDKKNKVELTRLQFEILKCSSSLKNLEENEAHFGIVIYKRNWKEKLRNKLLLKPETRIMMRWLESKDQVRTR